MCPSFTVYKLLNYFFTLPQDSNEIERELASGFAEQIAPDTEIIKINEGEEPEELWNALGGKAEYKDSFESDLRAVGEARLYHLNINARGKITVEEIDEFTQRDLVEDDVMVLDDGDVVYVWIGSGASEEEKKQATEGAEVNYLA